MNKLFCLTFIMLMLAIQPALAQYMKKELQNGDLLFVIVNEEKASDFARSIVGSTQGIDSKKISHVAIVCKEDSGMYVLEATGKGVIISPLDSFYTHSPHSVDGEPMVIAGRVKGNVDLVSSLRQAKGYIGRKYDFIFSDTDDEFYCSELVQKSYHDKDGKLVFDPIPMSFHDDKGRILKHWIEHYKKRGLEVPEGAPGSNPGALSRHERVEIFIPKR
ncbi:MAG: hypothetical protein K6E54_05140 [Bacteroidaceae bacterium]|nr:hypothetical protein [Bacteroidaceae bacterium]